MMRSGNPALNEKTFGHFDLAQAIERDDAAALRMTLQGTVYKAGMLLAFLVLAATFTWYHVMPHGPAGGINTAAVQGWLIGGVIAGLVLAIITIMKPAWSPITAPLYAIAEGLFLGAISAFFEAQVYQGIVIQAVALTFGTMCALLLAYITGLIKPTENFKLGVTAATGGIFIVYLATWVLGMFGVGIPYIHGSGWIGIGFSAFVVVIAALNLVLDFDFIETGVERGAPKHMEWFGAFGLMVTLIWLYIEILILLSKLQSRE